MGEKISSISCLNNHQLLRSCKTFGNKKVDRIASKATFLCEQSCMKLHDEIYCHRDCYESHALIVCNDMLSMYTIKLKTVWMRIISKIQFSMSKTCKLNIWNGLLYKKLPLLNRLVFCIISSFYFFSSALNVCNIRIIENIIDTTPPWHINTKYQNIRVSVCFNGIALTHVAVNLTLVLYSSSSPFRQDGLHCEFLYHKKLFVLY